MADLQLGIKITADGNQANATLTSVEGNLSKFSRTAKNARQSVDDLHSGWAKLSADFNARLAAEAQLQKLTQYLNQSSSAVRNLHTESQAAAAQQSTSWGSVASAVGRVQKAFIALGAAQVAISAGKSYIDTARQLDALNGAMEAASGSAAMGSKNLEYVKGVAETLGLELVTTAQSFAKLTASSNGTTLQGQSTRDIFFAVSKAASSLGLSADEAQGALLAISQMMSKGKVQAEELRGQLGERLPGAFNIAAKAMGVTTAELDKMLSNGQVIAADFLPKFAVALDETYSKGRFDRINNEINRLSNAWTELKQNFINTESFATAIRSLGDMLKGISSNINGIFGNGDDSRKKALEMQLEYERKALAERQRTRSALGPLGGLAFPDTEIEKRKQNIREIEQKLSEFNQKLAENVAKGTGEAIVKGIQAAAPPKIDQVQQMISEAAKKYGVPEAFALAIAKTESGFNQGAVSPRGAIGIGQLMPGTAKDLGVDARDLAQNIDGMMRYLKKIMGQFHGDLRLTAAGYNAGPNNASLQKGVLPNYKETQDYVAKVSKAYDQFLNQYPGGLPFADAESQKKELSDAEARFKTHLDRMVQDAQNAAKAQTEATKTQEMAIELARKQAEARAATAIDQAPNQEAKLRAIEELRQAEESYVQNSLALAQQQINAQQSSLTVRLSALQEELGKADAYNLTITQRAAIEKEIAATQMELRGLSEQRSQAEIAAATQQLDAEKKIQDLQKNPQGLQDVREEQLRMNAVFENGVQQAQLFASQAQQAFGAVGESIGKIIVSGAQFMQQNYQIGRDLKNQIDTINKEYKDGLMDQAKAFEETEKAKQMAALKTSQYQVALFGDMSSAAMGFFKTGSKGYAALEGVTKAFRTMQMVLALRAMAVQLMGIEAVDAAEASSVAITESSEAAKAEAHATTSIAAQGEIPIVGFALMAAMAAAMAALGIMHANVAANNPNTRREDYQKTMGTGTVLGDSSAQSETITNSLQAIKDNTSNDLNYSAAMLNQLQKINDALSGASAMIFQSVVPRLTELAGSFNKRSWIPGTIGGRNQQSVTDAGLYVPTQSLAKFVAGGLKGVLEYMDITKTTKLFGSTVSQSTETKTQGAAKDVVKQFNTVITDIIKAMQEGAVSFGISGEDFAKKLEGFKINIGKISLQGLSSDDAAKAISAVFSKLTDKMAKALMKDSGLDQFQKLGEGLGTTFFRVAEGASRAKGLMEQMGLSVIEINAIKNKQGDVAAEMVRQTLESQAQLSTGVRTYIDQLSGSAEDIIAAYKKLVEASNLMRTAGLNVENLDRTMINAAGGLDAFTSAMATFNDKFISEGERLGGLAATMSRQFMNLGLVMPTSSEGFRALVSGIDTSTDAGKKLFGQVIALSESFSTLQDKIKSVQDKYATVLNPFASIKTQIQSVVTDFNGLIAASAEQIKSTGPFTQQIKDLTKGQFDATASQKDWMQKKIDKQKQIDALEQQLADTIAKSPKKTKVIADLKNQILMAKVDMMGIDTAIGGFALVISDYDQKIKDAVAANDQALADSLSADKAQKLKDMGAVLVSTIESFWKSLTDGIKNLQSGIASQIAQLQGPGAVAALARTNASNAMGAVTSYFGGLKPGDTRNIQKELTLIGDAKQAIMDKYNAELALIQEATQAQIDALNTQMQAQVDAINADTEARVKAIQDQLAAEIEAKQKANQAALEGLQKELEAANKLKAAIQAVQNYAKGLALGGNSPLSPEARLMEAQRQYQTLLAKAKAGDADAISQLSGASDAYLTAAKAYYGSGTQYSNIFDGVKQAMEQIGGMSAPDPDSIQSHIDQLREQQQKEMDALNKAAQDQITAIQKAAQDQIATLQKDVAQQIKDLQDPNKNAAIQALKDETIKSLEALQELSKSTAEEANRQAQQAYDLALQEFEFSRDQRDYLKSIADSMGLIVNTQQFGSRPMMDPSLIPGHAAGGLASRGLALVGEKGPEIVNFESPGQVLTADETRDALSGNSSEMQALMKEFITEARAIVNVQRAANPQIIEKLDQMATAFESERRNARIHKAKA